VYTHRPERFGELISQERSGVTSYFHYDGAHSTRLLTDDNGDITDTYIFSAYGELVARTGTTTNPFGYKGAVGYYTNSATGDIYVRARSYQPVTGRWLSMDPLGFVDGPNLYRAYFVPRSFDATGSDVGGSVTRNGLTVTETKRNFPPSECGQHFIVEHEMTVNSDVMFDDEGVGRDCYLIQRVQLYCLNADCDTNCNCEYDRGHGLTFEFLEAIGPLVIDEASPESSAQGHTFSEFTHPSKCGHHHPTAEAKVYCGDRIKSMLESWDVNAVYVTKKCFAENHTGRWTLPIRGGKFPNFWLQKPDAGPVTYDLWVTWTCCGPPKDAAAAGSSIR